MDVEIIILHHMSNNNGNDNDITGEEAGSAGLEIRISISC